MQKVSKMLFLISTVVLIASSCSKQALDVDKNYKGIWSTDTLSGIHSYYIITANNSSVGLLCEAYCTTCQCHELASGKAKVNRKQTKISVGDTGKRIIQNIDQPPFKDTSGRWTMEIDGSLFHKQ